MDAQNPTPQPTLTKKRSASKRALALMAAAALTTTGAVAIFATTAGASDEPTVDRVPVETKTVVDAPTVDVDLPFEPIDPVVDPVVDNDVMNPDDWENCPACGMG